MFYLNDVGVLCTLGDGVDAIAQTLVVRGQTVPDAEQLFDFHSGRRVGYVRTRLAPLDKSLARFDCRNNRLAAAALEQMRPALDAALERYGKHRVAVVMGTSTSGIGASEEALKSVRHGNGYPQGFDAIQGVLGGLGEFVSRYLGSTGPVLTVSTACTSSANAILSARRLLDLGLCDAVVVGGVDSFCELTMQGFGALEALSANLSTPFSSARDGINIGEAAALFLMSRERVGAALLGGAATSDAHHISAPHPEGEGAFGAMEQALENAGLEPTRIDYLNAHGTGTVQNDAMESKAINRLFGEHTPCGSTKAFTGHTLGACGALELAFCWMLLRQRDDWRLPPSLYGDLQDPGLAAVGLTGSDDHAMASPQYCMSNSFAFGGSNVSLVIGTIDE